MLQRGGAQQKRVYLQVVFCCVFVLFCGQWNRLFCLLSYWSDKIKWFKNVKPAPQLYWGVPNPSVGWSCPGFTKHYKGQCLWDQTYYCSFICQIFKWEMCVSVKVTNSDFAVHSTFLTESVFKLNVKRQNQWKYQRPLLNRESPVPVTRKGELGQAPDSCKCFLGPRRGER